MEISGINSNNLIKINQNPFQNNNIEQEKSKTQFSSVVKGYLENVNNTDADGKQLNVKATTGEVENVHDVTIATQKAKVALELTVTVRDKAVEAYQEIMRMQI